jgi:AcrR family transcriptional regulator
VSINEQVREATLRVIATEGVKSVTIRRIAQELGRSTTVVTHYFADRDELLRTSVEAILDERRVNAEQVIAESEDALWGFLEWSIQADHSGVWPAIVASSVAGLEPEIARLAEEFGVWWSETLLKLLENRCSGKLNAQQTSDAIGIVVEGLILASEREMYGDMSKLELLRVILEPLITPKR